MTGPDFDHFCELARVRSGLILNASKVYLVQSRLDPLARARGFANVPALLAALRRGGDEGLVCACVDAMATHESLFFRDSAPFDQLAAVVLPHLARTRPAGQPLRIWSAACSSGQEPYSIAMLIQEHSALLAGRRVEIIATDMAEAVLAKARAGSYSDFEINRGLSPARRDRWLKQRASAWEISAELKAMVTFRRHNLLDPMASAAGFDVVFCRNVLIYFDPSGKTQALRHIGKVIAPDGTLILGSAESVIGLDTAFEPVTGTRGLFQPRPHLATPVGRVA